MQTVARNTPWRGRRLAFEPLERRLLLAETPLITEFMAANDTTLDDEDGDDSDWIEIYNPTTEHIDLAGWHLTDSPGDLEKWTFPSVTLDPSSFLVVFASDKNRGTAGQELHANFKLDADGEYVALATPDGSIVSEFMTGGNDFPRQQTDISYGLSMSVETVTPVIRGASARIHVPTSGAIDDVWMHPGFDDAHWDVGVTAIGYETSPFPDNGELITTEIPAGATSVYIRIPFTLSDPYSLESLTLRMHYDDGFVAYLNGVLVASANAPAEPKWDSTATRHHVIEDEFFPFDEFRLDEFRGALRSRENVLAIHGLNARLETALYPDMFILPELTATDAILLNESPGLLPEPTPGLTNGTAFAALVEPPTVSADRGFYDEPTLVALATPTPGAEIRYTTNGSPPTASNGTNYAGPLTIDRTTTLRAAAFRPGYAASPVVTQTYIFVDDVIQQDYDATLAAGLPPTWGGRPADYGMDPDVIGPGDHYGGVYAATIRDDLRALPTVSIAMDADDMFGPEGIYTLARQRGANWERAASVELVDSADQEEFQSNVALRIHGGASRGQVKKSLRLLFKSDFGPPTLEFPFFGPDAAQEFNTLVLRMEFNDGFLWGKAKAQYARDEFARRTQLAMGWPSARGRYVHVYINGIYWGVYNAAERPDAAFASSYYGGDREEWDVIHQSLGTFEATDGDFDAWNTLLALAGEVAAATSPEEKNAAYMRLVGLNPDGTANPDWESYLDIDNYIDYLILNYFVENTDWPHNNWYAARRRGSESQGFVFHVWDAEWTLGHRLGSGGTRIGASPGNIDLTSSEEFRIRFADRVQRHFFNGGPLYVKPDLRLGVPWDAVDPGENLPAARYVAVTDEVRLGLVAESARWGDAESPVPITPNVEWEAERQMLLQRYFPSRSSYVLNLLRAANLFPRPEVPIFSQRGGEVAEGYQLILTSTDQSTIYYTLNGTDPRLVGGGISPTAIEYKGPITVSDGMFVRTRALKNLTWTALDQAEFVVNPDFPQIAGDYTGNGRVEQGDLDLVLLHWGVDAMELPGGWISDLANGIIDQNELDRVLLNWGAPLAALARSATPFRPTVEPDGFPAPVSPPDLVLALEGPIGAGLLYACIDSAVV